MGHEKLYYIWIYLPDKLRLPHYMCSKERRDQISGLILKSIEGGEATVFQAGMGRPGENVKKTIPENTKGNHFTNVVLKISTKAKIDFTRNENALLSTFLHLFRRCDMVSVTGDNTRLNIDTDKYRQVILQGVTRI